MSLDISNVEIEKIIEKNGNYVKINFTGVFKSNHINHFIFHNLLKEKDSQYPFMLSITDRSDKNRTQSCSIFDLHSKKEIFLFGSFGLKGLKNLIIQDDKKIINKTLFGLGKLLRISSIL